MIIKKIKDLKIIYVENTDITFSNCQFFVTQSLEMNNQKPKWKNYENKTLQLFKSKHYNKEIPVHYRGSFVLCIPYNYCTAAV